MASDIVVKNDVKYFDKASLSLRGRMRVLHLKGTPYEMGFQQGTLMREEILSGALMFFSNLLGDLLAHSMLARMPAMATKLAAKYLETFVINRLIGNFPESNMQEIRGMADALGVDCRMVSKAFVMPDVTSYLIGMLDKNRKTSCMEIDFGNAAKPCMGCTSFVAFGPATTDGKLLHGRNLDFIGMGFWDRFPTVIYYHPDDGLNFMTPVTAGVMGGGLTSMNEAGVCFDLHQNYTTDICLKNPPILSIGDKIIRNAHNLDEAVGIATSTLPVGGWTIILSDGNRPECVALELSGAQWQEVPHAEGALSIANTYMTPTLKPTEVELNRGITINSYARLRRMQELVARNYGNIDPETAAEILGDHYDMNTGRVRGIGDLVTQLCNLCSVVMKPSEGKMWVSTGVAPSCNSRFMGFDLSAGEAVEPEFLEGNEFNSDPRLEAVYELLRAEESYYKMDFEAAAEHFVHAVEIDPEEPNYRFLLGLVYLRLGTPAPAAEAIEQSLQFPMTEYKLMLFQTWLARAYDLLGRRDEAVDLYNKVLNAPQMPEIHLKAVRKGLKRPYCENDSLFIFPEFWLGEEMEIN